MEDFGARFLGRQRKPKLKSLYDFEHLGHHSLARRSHPPVVLQQSDTNSGDGGFSDGTIVVPNDPGFDQEQTRDNQNNRRTTMAQRYFEFLEFPSWDSYSAFNL